LRLDHESSYRDSNLLMTRLCMAALRQNACLEDVDYRHSRRGWKRLYRLCACISGRSRRLKRALSTMPGRINEPAIERPDRCDRKLLASGARTNLIVSDDFGMAALGDDHRRDPLDILEDDYQRHSMIPASRHTVEP